MLVIRLQRTGRENLPAYRIVVAEKRSPVKSGFLEVLGQYLPTREPVLLDVREERVTHWVSKGAIPSNTVARLLAKKGMKGFEKFIVPYVKRQSKSAAAEQAQGGAQAPAATAPPAPVAKEDDTGKKEA